MARKPSDRSHFVETEGEINLSPIMSILVILIPMLLLLFNFHEIKVQAVAAPKVGSGQDQEKTITRRSRST